MKVFNMQKAKSYALRFLYCSEAFGKRCSLLLFKSNDKLVLQYATSNSLTSDPFLVTTILEMNIRTPNHDYSS